MNMNKKYFYTFITALFFVSIIFGSNGDSKSNKSLIKFSHKTHSEAAACTDCHSAVPTSTSLSDRLLPTMENCAQCHDVEADDNCTMCHYADIQEPLIQTKTDLEFNHSKHVNADSPKCETCHSTIFSIDYSYKASEDITPCYTCHNTASTILPETHKVTDFMKTHQFLVSDGSQNCARCHDNEFCETCHVSTSAIDAPNTSDNFYAPYSPHRYMNDSKMQQLTRVHDLNYQYTHGIDAKGKTSECQSCHVTETFCAECHASESEDFAAGGILPQSHLESNFVTIGVGTGGGSHAELAKRDIESCASCHDTFGGDPVCITCHMDNDGVKGTNPKTHETGFMSDSEGDWHSDNGSVCFTCHTNVTASTGIKGVGFCGYCHN